MSQLPRNIPFQRVAIEGIETVEDAKKWLSSFMKELDIWYAQLFDQVENGGMSTKLWRIKEATVQEALDGFANAEGDLMFQYKGSGVWVTIWSIRSQ